MGMGIHQTGHDVPAWKPLSSGDRLRDQAPGRIHPQVNRPVTIWQLHRAHSPRHSGIISPGTCARCPAVRAGVDAVAEAIREARELDAADFADLCVDTHDYNVRQSAAGTRASGRMAPADPLPGISRRVVR